MSEIDTIEYLRWVCTRRAHDNPRGDFIRDSRFLIDRLDRGFFDRETVDARLYGACHEAQVEDPQAPPAVPPGACRIGAGKEKGRRPADRSPPLQSTPPLGERQTHEEPDMNDLTTTRRHVLDVLGRFDAVSAAAKPGAKQPLTTRPKDAPTAPWRTHQGEGCLQTGLDRWLAEPDLSLYPVPGSIQHDGYRLSCFDVDDTDVWPRIGEDLPPPFLVCESPDKPGRFHVWWWTRSLHGCVQAWGRLDGRWRHVGEWRAASEKTEGVGMRMYPGEDEALTDALEADPTTGRLEDVSPLLRPKWIPTVERVCKRLAELPEGQRNSSLMGELKVLRRVMDHREEWEGMVVDAYEQAPGEPNDCASEIAHALDSLASSQPRARARSSAKTAETAFDAALTQPQCRGWELRYNRRAFREEVNRGDGWELIDDRIEARLHTAWMAAAGLDKPLSKLQWNLLRDDWMYDHQVDPFLQYIEGLPAWDQTPRLGGMLEALFHVPAGQSLIPWASRYICLAPVQRSYEPGCKLDEVPILIGRTGIGKSTVPVRLFPAELRAALFTDRLDFAAQAQRQVEVLQGKALVEAAELTGLTRSRLDAVKAFLTSVNDGDIRLSFRRNPDQMLRRCAFVGTAEPDESGILLSSPYGWRRFACINVGSQARQAIEPWMDANRAQLWAEALDLYRDGIRANLPRELMQDQAAANQPHMQEDMVLSEEIETRLPPSVFPASGLTLGEIAGRLGMLDIPGKDGERRPVSQLSKREEMRLAAALKDKRFWRDQEKVMISGNSARRWHPPA